MNASSPPPWTPSPSRGLKTEDEVQANGDCRLAFEGDGRVKYGVNLSTIWAGMPLEEQVPRVVAAGFHTIEFWFACRMDMPKLMELQQRYDLIVNLFNLDPDPVTNSGYLGEPEGEDR